LELTIEKLVYGGDGLARLPADEHGRGKTVFLPLVIPEERVDATVTETRSGFARARLNHLLTTSPHRVVPACPYFGPCGGCQYQHIVYPAQLRFKTDILRETLKRTAKLDFDHEIQLHSAEPWSYRNRTRLQVQHAPFTLGYFHARSHKLVAVEACPISSPLINQAIGVMCDLGRRGIVPLDMHGIQFFADHDDSRMLVEAYVRSKPGDEAYQDFAAELRETLPAVCGVNIVLSPVSDDTGEVRSAESAPIASIIDGTDHLTYHAVGIQYRVSAGSFFQTNRFLVDELARVATSGAEGKTALDLYAGVGLFSVLLGASFQTVVAVEASPQAVADLKRNAPPNVQCVCSTTEAFLAKQSVALKPDFVLLDPPRAGLDEKATTALCRTSASRVTYVSCDPATLSRDLRVLLESGFKVQRAHLVDLFPQTAHMETVLHLAR